MPHKQEKGFVSPAYSGDYGDESPKGPAPASEKAKIVSPMYTESKGEEKEHKN